MSLESMSISFSRELLRDVCLTLKKKHPHVHHLKDGWVWSGDRKHWEFHAFGSAFYRTFRAHNAYEARAKGWLAWMEEMENPK